MDNKLINELASHCDRLNTDALELTLKIKEQKDPIDLLMAEIDGAARESASLLQGQASLSRSLASLSGNIALHPLPVLPLTHRPMTLERFMKTAIAFLIGLVVGAIGGAGYFYPQIQNAMSNASLSQANIEALKKDAASAKATLEAAAKEAKDKLAAAIAERQAAEQAKQAAEKALEDAKKAAPQ
jgi:hypothetical protein